MKDKTAKVILTVAIAVVGFSLNAQNIGAEVGANFSNMIFYDDSNTYSNDFDLLTGFHIRGVYEQKFTDAFSAQVGLGVSQKGYKYEDIDEFEVLGETYTLEIRTRTSLIYVDVPILAKYKFVVGTGNIFVGAGTNIGIGAAGKYVTEATFNGNTEEDTEIVRWGQDENNDDFRRLDFGLKAIVGYDMESLYFQAGYEHGIANIAAYQDNGNTIKNSVISISVGYHIDL